MYRARHAVVGNEVALKVLWPDHADDPRKVERFVREARAAASLGHPNIVRVLDAGTTDGVTFLAMELLPGRDLESAIEARGPLPVRESVAILRQVLDALQAAHGRGIVHRDLKPANVFLVGDRDATQVRLLDFGISKMQHESKLTDPAAGSVAATDPERAGGERLDRTGNRPGEYEADDEMDRASMNDWDADETSMPLPKNEHNPSWSYAEPPPPPSWGFPAEGPRSSNPV